MRNLNKMAKDINEKIVAKGFGDRTFVEACMLIITEVEEAHQEYENGKSINETYYLEEKPQKPEGIPSELADIIIRILDLCGEYNIDIEKSIDELDKYEENSAFYGTFDCFCMSIVSQVSQAVEEFRKGRKVDAIYYSKSDPLNKLGVPTHFANIIYKILHIAKSSQIDMVAMIEIKTGFNDTREHKHGGKLL